MQCVMHCAEYEECLVNKVKVAEHCRCALGEMGCQESGTSRGVHIQDKSYTGDFILFTNKQLVLYL